MSDPNLPEGVTQKDIDATVGETFDHDLCEHWAIKCENCETSFEAIEQQMKDAGIGYHRLDIEKDKKIDNLKYRIQNIKVLCGYLDNGHPPNCSGWGTYDKKIIFSRRECDCFIWDILHEIEMTED